MEAQPCEGLEVGCSMRKREQQGTGSPCSPPLLPRPSPGSRASSLSTSPLPARQKRRFWGDPEPSPPALASCPASAKTGQVDSSPGVATTSLTTQGHHRDMAPKLKKIKMGKKKTRLLVV